MKFKEDLFTIKFASFLGGSIPRDLFGTVQDRLGPGGRCQESSASASAIGSAAAASATALTRHGADVLRQRARPEDAAPATADNEAKPSAATTATTTAATTK